MVLLAHRQILIVACTPSILWCKKEIQELMTVFEEPRVWKQEVK